MGLNVREAPERTASLLELLYPSKGANGFHTDKSACLEGAIAVILESREQAKPLIEVRCAGSAPRIV